MLGWPPGTAKTAGELRTLGISSALLSKYVRSGWLEPVNPDIRGAYKRAGDSLDWTGGLHALEQAYGDRFHAGGRTALELQGLAHYGAVRERAVFLFAPAKHRLPHWFVHCDWDARIVFSATSLFAHMESGTLLSHPIREYAIRVSCPERAMLEMLYHVPDTIGFDEAGQIIAGLGTLRPDMLQELLEGCGSVKVKRLCFYFARESGHAWLARLDPSCVDLGSGKRVIVPGGVLDGTYLITVPRAEGDGEPGF